MIFFLTSEVMKAVRGQKHPSEAKKGMKEMIYWKEYWIKVSQQPQKPFSGSNQIWAATSDKKDTATSEVTVAAAAAGSNIPICIATYVWYMMLLLCSSKNKPAGLDF